MFSIVSSGFFSSRKSVTDYLKMCDQEKADYRSFIALQIDGYLAAGMTMLELGSGGGHDLQLLQSRYRLTASDSSSEFLRILKKRFPKTPRILLDIRSFHQNRQIQSFKANSLDAIYSNKVLIYFTEREIVLSFRRQSALIKNRGFLFHTFWQEIPPSAQQKEQFMQTLLNATQTPKIDRTSESLAKKTVGLATGESEQSEESLSAPRQQNCKESLYYHTRDRLASLIEHELDELLEIRSILSYREQNANDSLLVVLQKK